MSLFNVQQNEQRAVIAADTLRAHLTTTGDAAGFDHVSKLAVIPHLGAVFVARGSDRAILAAQHFLLDCGLDSIVDAKDGLGDVLKREVKAARPPEGTDATAAEALTSFHGALVGYSPTLGRIATFVFADPASPLAWGRMVGPGPLIACFDRIADQDAAKAIGSGEPTREDAFELARMQFESVAGLMRYGFGGHLTVAEVDRDGVRVELHRGFFDAILDTSMSLKRAEIEQRRAG